jgi:Ca2+-binding RTX toxin-like protein
MAPAANEASQAPSPPGEDTGLAAHASVRSGGAGFHHDDLATLEVATPADPLQSGRLYGDAGDNTLTSSEGAVILFGGRGDDVLVSNGDGDRLSGGRGADTFVFTAFESLRVGVIDGLGRGDHVDLSIVAVQYGLDHFTATTAFDGHAGQVTAAYDAAHDRTVFRFDTDGDGHADHRLVVNHGDYSDFGFFLDVDRSGLLV